MKINVGVFFGGASVEHEVSIISALQAIAHFDREKYNVVPVYIAKNGLFYTGDNLFAVENFKDMGALLKRAREVTLTKGGILVKHKRVNIDVAFPVVHGTNCEDGCLQGLFEMYGMPYVGCDVLSSAVGMDKAVFKSVMRDAGLPVLPCVRVNARDYFADMDGWVAKIEEIGYPVIVKPVNLGSSVGIKLAHDRDGLKEAMEYAASFSDKLLAERAITSLREINCSVLGDEDGAEASVLEEPFTSDEILSYADKYLGGGKGEGSKGMVSLARRIPAELPEEKAAEIRDIAVKAFTALGAGGVARIDFMLDTADGDRVYINEINTIPGSLAFYLWEKKGVPYKELIDRLIDLAFSRKRRRDGLTFSIDTNILAGASLGTKGSKGSKL